MTTEQVTVIPTLDLLLMPPLRVIVQQAVYLILYETERRAHRAIEQGEHGYIVQPAEDRFLAYTEDTRDYTAKDGRIILEAHLHEVAHEDYHTIIIPVVESHMNGGVILIEQYQRGHTPMSGQQFG